MSLAAVSAGHPFDEAVKAGRQPYKVKDLNLADFGRQVPAGLPVAEVSADLVKAYPRRAGGRRPALTTVRPDGAVCVVVGGTRELPRVALEPVVGRFACTV